MGGGVLHLPNRLAVKSWFGFVFPQLRCGSPHLKGGRAESGGDMNEVGKWGPRAEKKSNSQDKKTGGEEREGIERQACEKEERKKKTVLQYY